MNFKLLNFLIVIISLLMLSSVVYISLRLLKQPASQNAQADLNLNDLAVVRVLDGDTFQLYNNQIIRLICIDTPEEGRLGFEESKIFLESLILNKVVRLESDNEDQDIYGRSLRYVYVNSSGSEVFVNKEIITYGFGEVFRYGNNTKRCDEIEG